MEETLATMATVAEETLPTVIVEVVETTPEVLEQIYGVITTMSAQIPYIGNYLEISVNLIVLGVCTMGLTAGILLGARLWGWMK